MNENLLLIIDPQWDFISGTLAVKGASEAMYFLKKYIVENIKEGDNVAITIDFHPYNHCSFKKEGGQWPTHCVMFSKGCSVSETIMDAVQEVGAKITFFKKGTETNVEEYSFLSFMKGDFSNYIDMSVEDKIIDLFSQFETIYVSGIAGDYCVLETLKDMEPVHNKIKVLGNCVASIDEGKALTEYCKENNIEII